jgi:homoserine O-succinyltransferase
MPIILPKGLPIVSQLRSEGIVVLDEIPAGRRPLRVLFLNIMPQKEVTELDFARVLGASSLVVELLPMKISGQTYKTTPMAHMDAFYRDFETFEDDFFDGLIITGAPVEHLPFEEVRYWPQLQHIFDWATRHVRSTLYVCWGGQAGLYHHYGISKYVLPAKMFGVFPHRQLIQDLPLFKNMEQPFPMPNSRHTEVRCADILSCADLSLVAASDESGAGVVLANSGREIYIVGHLEYEPGTLDKEYQRDLGKGLSIAQPLHYYMHDNPSEGVSFSWGDTALRFYDNWLRYYVAAGSDNV